MPYLWSLSVYSDLITMCTSIKKNRQIEMKLLFPAEPWLGLLRLRVEVVFVTTAGSFISTALPTGTGFMSVFRLRWTLFLLLRAWNSGPLGLGTRFYGLTLVTLMECLFNYITLYDAEESHHCSWHCVLSTLYPNCGTHIQSRRYDRFFFISRLCFFSP